MRGTTWDGVRGMPDAAKGLSQLATGFGETGVGEPVAWAQKVLPGLLQLYMITQNILQVRQV